MADIKTKVVPAGAGTITYTVIDQGTNTIRLIATPDNRKYTFLYWTIDDLTTEIDNNPFDYVVGSSDVTFIAHFDMYSQPLSLYDDKQGHVGVCLGSLALDARDKVISELDTILRNTEFREGATITVIDETDPDDIQVVTKPAYKIFSTEGNYVEYISTDTDYANTIRIMSGTDYDILVTKDPHTLYFLTSLPS